MDLLENIVQPYAWGSRSAIAQLQGRPTPSVEPEAELWMGAHPGAPSRVVRGAARASLLDVLQHAPDRVLGAECVRAFGPQLPFLFKVLAAESPLSLQAHPSLDQAREGYRREDGLGVSLSAPHRNYKDANHKPELICALTPFDALCGFRDAEETLALFERLQVAVLEDVLAPLRASPDARGFRGTFERLMTLEPERRRAAVEGAVDACRRVRDSEPLADACAWAVRLGERYPGDPGVVGALLLNLVRLEPGEAIYLPAGNLHAYLSGVGVELMANSDNVLRGGCTPKHVDVPELLRVLDFRTGSVPRVRGVERRGEHVYPTPAREFQLSRIELRKGRNFAARHRRGAEILLCTEGSAELQCGGATLALSQGASAFIAACDGDFRLHGQATIYRATVGDLG